MTDTSNTTPPAPINWGDEVKPDSVWSFTHLGYPPIERFADFGLMILSRDGSRRIVRAVVGAVANPEIWPQYILDPPDPTKYFQGWEGVKLFAEYIKDDPGQTVLLIQNPKGEDERGFHRMPGWYMPYPPLLPQTRTVEDPVNPIPRINAVRDAISAVAAGWDATWHGRYIFSDHLRQQVTSRLVDGLLAAIVRDIDTLLAAARPAENTAWQAKLPPIEAAAKAVCSLCSGDPYVWARILARNCDLNAFRVRLDRGEVPAVNQAAEPWQPGATVAALTVPPNTDVNAKKELVARWHDANRTLIEQKLLAWYDEVFLDPEPHYQPTGDHFHLP